MMLLLVFGVWAGGLVDVGDVEVSGDSAEAVGAAREALDKMDFARAASLYEALADSGGGVPARLSEAVARYEGGDVHGAERAAQQVLQAQPGNAAAANLLGLCLVDGGQVAKGITQLEAARVVAERAGDAATVARTWVNRGLALLDQGDPKAAGAAFDTAAAAAPDRPDIAAAVAQGREAVKGLAGSDRGVGPLLARGKLADARTAAQLAAGVATVPRQKVNAAIDLAAVERAEGNLDGAAARLGGAVKAAREAGMAREVALSLGNLGLVYALGGRLPLAEDALRAGAKVAQEGGYRVAEVDLRNELGLVLVNLGRLPEAETEQRAAGALLAGMDYPQGVVRQAELGGVLAGARGDAATARSALSQAVSWHEGRGRVLDAARVSTELAAALQPTDPAGAESWAQKARGYFAQAGDPMGPAHVAMARALADARAHHLESSLKGFADAAGLAEKVGGARGAAVAKVARDNAAQTLVALGAGEDVAKVAAQQGLGDLLARQASMKTGFDDYDAGLTAYEAASWEVARGKFQAARVAFEKLGEDAYAQRARRAAAWSAYNGLVRLPAAKAYPQWQALVDETTHVDDPELFTRAYAAAALAAHQLGQGDPRARLEECGRRAEQAGLNDVAARCHGALAERDGDLETRAREARTAALFAPADPAAVYALYAVAVDAYNGGRADLALALAREARPHAGNLAQALDDLIKAAAAE